MPLKLKLLENRFMICRFDKAPPNEDCWAVIHDHDGWTLIQSHNEGNWKAIQIDQEFGLDEVGILLEMLKPLAQARIPIMAYSTYRTDYVFVKLINSSAAIHALRAAGHQVSGA